MFSIRTKLLFLLVPITLALLASLGYVNYLRTAEFFTQSTQESLQTIGKAKEGALVEYIESTEKLGSAIAATDIVQSYIGLANRNLKGNNLETLNQLGERVENLLLSFQETHWGRYHHIFLLNRSNRIVISPNHGVTENEPSSTLLDKDLSANPWAMGAFQKGKVMISGYWGWKTGDHSHQVLFYPVRDVGNRIQAVIGIELQTPYQQQILSEGFSLGESGHIYMTTEKGAAIVKQDIGNRTSLTGEALTQAKLDGTWSGRRKNAQGDEVFGYYAKHNKYPWILAVEIDTDEVLGSLYDLQIVLAAGLGLVLFILTVISLTFANTIVRPLRELASQMERISRGEFNIDIPDTRRKDEIGTVIGALQQVVFSLQIVSKKLRLVKTMKKAS